MNTLAGFTHQTSAALSVVKKLLHQTSFCLFKTVYCRCTDNCKTQKINRSPYTVVSRPPNQQVRLTYLWPSLFVSIRAIRDKS
jgi:hypothetical protein